MIAQNLCRDAALRYLVNLNFSVIPIGSDKKPLVTWKPYQTERPTVDQVRQWFAENSNANVGIVTGEISGIFVLDCDDQQAVDRVMALGTNDTLEVSTSRGKHFYFKLPGFPVTNTTDLFGSDSHIDIRGNGGYVVAPPSVHPTGAVYEFANEANIGQAPDWLLDMLRPKVKNSTRGQQSAAPTINGSGKTAVNKAYIQAAFDRELDAVRYATEGNRNDTLNIAAFNLGQLVAVGALDVTTVSNALFDAAIQLGLDEIEARSTIGSGLRAGKGQPRTLPAPTTRTNESAASVTVMSDETSDQDQSDPNNLTDLGSAKKFVGWYGEEFRYNVSSGKYYIYDGTRWAIDEDAAINRVLQKLPARLYREASELPPDAGRVEAIRYALKCEMASKMDAILRIARTLKGITVRANQLDADPWSLNTRNGTLDLRSGMIRKHNRRDLNTRRIEVAFDPLAKCPEWNRFLARVTNDDQELIEFLKRMVGYMLTGDVSEQCLFFLFGSGRNGKTTFLETLTALLGEYTVKTPTETLMARDRSSATNDLARIAGRRLVIANETNEGQRLDEAKIKGLTGGDTITARFLFGEFFEFKPTHKLLIAGNHKPTIRGVDTGIWRRLKLVPFIVTIPEDEVDPLLPEKLRTELSGILNWALDGCLTWQRDGLGEPLAVKAATAEYRTEMDSLADFISEKLTVNKDSRVAVNDIYEAYKKWAEESGEKELTKTRLGIALRDRGFQEQKSGSIRYWRGIELQNSIP